MTKVDQFESVFRAASKTVFEYESINIDNVLVISDATEAEAAVFAAQVRNFLRVLGDSARWRVVNGTEFDEVPSLLALVEAERPALICTYRHLHSDSWKWPYTLGEYVDVLTQVTDTPVVVLPHPEAMRASPHALGDTSSVMAMTDHLTGDRHLINYAVRFVEPGGALILTHVEDEVIFDRYIETISRIPSIDTESAEHAIRTQLLREPQDYIQSCRDALGEAGLSVDVETIVTMGRHIREYERLIEEHEVDLLVFNTKEEDQLAMHGLAYSLAIELRQIPLLLL